MFQRRAALAVTYRIGLLMLCTKELRHRRRKWSDFRPALGDRYGTFFGDPMTPDAFWAAATVCLRSGNSRPFVCRSKSPAVHPILFSIGASPAKCAQEIET